MVTRSAELGRRYGELTTEIQQLEHDRALAESELRDYRERSPRRSDAARQRTYFFTLSE